MFTSRILYIKNAKKIESSCSSEEEAEVEAIPPVTSLQALGYINFLRQYIEQQVDVDDNLFKSVQQLEEFAMTKQIRSLKQSTMTDYLSQKK